MFFSRKKRIFGSFVFALVSVAFGPVSAQGQGLAICGEHGLLNSPLDCEMIKQMPAVTRTAEGLSPMVAKSQPAVTAADCPGQLFDAPSGRFYAWLDHPDAAVGEAAGGKWKVDGKYSNPTAAIVAFQTNFVASGGFAALDLTHQVMVAGYNNPFLPSLYAAAVQVLPGGSFTFTAKGTALCDTQGKNCVADPNGVWGGTLHTLVSSTSCAAINYFTDVQNREAGQITFSWTPDDPNALTTGSSPIRQVSLPWEAEMNMGFEYAVSFNQSPNSMRVDDPAAYFTGVAAAGLSQQALVFSLTDQGGNSLCSPYTSPVLPAGANTAFEVKSQFGSCVFPANFAGTYFPVTLRVKGVAGGKIMPPFVPEFNGPIAASRKGITKVR